MSNDFDFGFTTEDEIKGEQEKVKGVVDMIMPFLNNLKGDVTKDVIKWNGRDRAKQIDAFIKKMNDYINS